MENQMVEAHPVHEHEYVDSHSKGVNSLIFGILSYLVPIIGFVLAILAIIYGNAALKVIVSSEGKNEGKVLAITGKALGIVNIVLTIIGIAGFFIMIMIFGISYSELY